MEVASLLVSAGALLIAVGCALYIRASGPIATREVLTDLLRQVTAQSDELAQVGVRWETYRQGVDSLLEELTHTEDRVERNRRRTSQAAARVKRNDGGGDPAQLSSDDQLLVAARNQGHQV